MSRLVFGMVSCQNKKFYFVFSNIRQYAVMKLLAHVMNSEVLCPKINFYTYWQGFGYAEKTPESKYLIVSQSWEKLCMKKSFFSQ